MEPLFCNETVMDAAACRDFLAMTWPQNARVTRPALFVLGGVALFYAVRQVVLYRAGALPQALHLLLAAAVAVFLAGWGYLLRVRRYVAAQRQAWGGETLAKTVVFYRDEIIQTSVLGSLRFSWRQVSGISKTRGSFLLRLGAHNALLVRRSGFAAGESSDDKAFLAYINERIKRQKNG